MENNELTNTPGMDMIAAGATMQQVKTQYTTAVSIQKRRSIPDVNDRCIDEAKIMGEACYYNLPFKSDGGTKNVEGLTIDAALMIARNFGNCAVDTLVTETPQAFMYTSYFVDLETGFNLSRTFRQNKVGLRKRDGTPVYKGERGEDISFQIGQSKSMRNVILNAVPEWLKKNVMDTAKENILRKLQEIGAERAAAKIIERAAKVKITEQFIAEQYGVNWKTDFAKMVMIIGNIKAVELGESIESVFNIVKDDPAKDLNEKLKKSKTEKVSEVLFDEVQK